MRVKEEEQEDSSPTSRSPSPLTSASSDLGQSSETAAKSRKQQQRKPERKCDLSRQDKTTAACKYDLEKQLNKEPESKRLLEKVNEILKSCDQINQDDKKSVERERGEREREPVGNREREKGSESTRSIRHLVN